MLYHSMNINDIVQDLNSNTESGLSTDQVNACIEKHGENKLRSKDKKSLIVKFLEQFKDAMIIILLIACIISFALAINNMELSEFFDPILILFIVIMNAAMGVFQENKAEKALDALKDLSAPHAKVIRNGKKEIIEAFRLVCGDIIIIEAGDFVPADARLLDSANLKVEESALTGESVATEKSASSTVPTHAAIGDRVNMVYSGCSVVYGHAKAIVTATGMNTEIGKIANLLDNEKEQQTPLQAKLTTLSKYLGILVIVICAAIFFIGLLEGFSVMEIFMIAVSLAVAAIPEGLPAIVTIILAIGVQRMTAHNAIIRKIPAVETLGSASVICSDKTGTLTQNRMTLLKTYTDRLEKCEVISPDKYSEETKMLLQCGTLCCDGSIVIDNDKINHIGDPTETAIVFAAYEAGIIKEDLNEKYPRMGDLPFDSERKFMSVICRVNGKNLLITKGGFDIIAPRCIHGNIEKAQKVVEEMSNEALRVLAIAYRELDDNEVDIAALNKTGLCFVGLLGMMDPARPEVKNAIRVCLTAGIKPVMITGDHVITACAIARELGIITLKDSAITGKELAEMTDSELYEKVQHISVYARVSPEDKIRIVKAWQSQGHTVAMTGDGVNDAPALKAADIGCAMGITGTDVAKEAADIVLTDDNFSTIVRAVKEGRGIYSNIKKSIIYLLGTNIGEILAVLTTLVFWRKSILLSVHLLWINLVTDSLPAIALGRDNIRSNIMNQKPIPRHESLFANRFGLKMCIQSVMFMILTVTGFAFGLSTSGDIEVARTYAFLILSLTEVFHAFNMRSDSSIFKIGVFSNKFLNQAALISIVLIAVVTFTPPINQMFSLKILPLTGYALVVFIAFSSIIIMEILKLFAIFQPKVKRTLSTNNPRGI